MVRGRDCRYVEWDVQLRHRPSRSQAFPGSATGTVLANNRVARNGFSAERSNSNALMASVNAERSGHFLFLEFFAPRSFFDADNPAEPCVIRSLILLGQGEMLVRWLIAAIYSGSLLTVQTHAWPQACVVACEPRGKTTEVLIVTRCASRDSTHCASRSYRSVEIPRGPAIRTPQYLTKISAPSRG